MHDLMRDEVTEHEIRRKDETPVEGEVFAGRAVAPLRALAHHVDPPGLLPNARGHYRQVVRNGRACLSSQPILETSHRRRLRLRPAANDDLPVAQHDAVSASLRIDELDAHWGRFAAIQDLAGLPPHWPPQRTKTRHAVELGEHPTLVSAQERRYVLVTHVRRLHDLDAAWTDPNAGLVSGLGDDHVVVYASSAQHDPLLSYGLHQSDTPSDLASSSTVGFRNGGSAALLSNPSRSKR